MGYKYLHVKCGGRKGGCSYCTSVNCVYRPHIADISNCQLSLLTACFLAYRNAVLSLFGSALESQVE